MKIIRIKITCWVGVLLIAAVVFYDIITIVAWIKTFKGLADPESRSPLIVISGSLIIIGNLCIIVKIAHKTGEERISIRSFVNRVLTFYSTVLSNNSIEVLIGFVGQVILSIVYWTDPEKFIYFIIYTLVFFGFSAAPILRELINNLEGVYIKAFYGKLERRLTRMEKQYIIIGYGRFGKTVINDLFENYVYNEPKIKSIYSEGRYHWRNPLKRNSKFKIEEADKEKKPVLLLERMFNEGCEEILFCINMVIIDEERLLSKAFPHPYFGKMGVVILDGLNCLRYDKENYKKQVYIPAIVGDARDSLTLDFARVNNSKMVLSLIPEEDAAPQLFDIVYKKQGERKGIITGTTTAQERLLIPQSYNTNISFLHRDRIRGWELGDIVVGNLLNKSDYKNVKILILGCGKQLHFLLEKIWLEIIWKKEGINKNFLENNCLIIGNDEYINNSTITKDGYTYWNHELAYVTNRNAYKRDDYKMLIPYLKGIPDEPVLLCPIVSGEVQQCMEQEPFKRVNPEFFKKRPEIIIISSDSREEVLKVFNDLNSISKKYHLIPKPAIVAESNPDIEKVIMELNKAHIGTGKSETKYPIQLLSKPWPIEFSENVVNTFEDGKKMVRGYIEAGSRDAQLILMACVEDKPGAFAKLCFLLANLSVTNPATENTLVPSFHNTQALSQRNDYFCFFSDADLIEKEKLETSGKLEKLPNGVEFPEDLKNKIRYDDSQQLLIFEGIMSKEEKDKLLNLSSIDDVLYKKAIEALFQRSQMVKIESDNANHIREVFVSSTNRKNKEQLINMETSEKLEKLPNGVEFPEDLKNKIRYDSSRQLLIYMGIMSNKERDTLLNLSQDAPYNNAINGLSQGPQTASSLIPPTSTQSIYGSCMSLTFCSVCSFRESIKAESDPLTKSDKEKARWKNNEDPELNLNKIEKNERYEKFARIYACCKGGDVPGATAMLLYKFMLGESEIKWGKPRKKQVLNIRYVMNVECYNPGFELLKMYGNLDPYKETNLNTLYSECLQGIVISPVRHENDWWNYSQKLKSKVSDSVFYYDGENESPNNILIITNDYRDILLKEYIQLEVERKVDDACIQGDIKEPSAEKLKLELYEKFRDLLRDKSLKDKTKETLKTLVTNELSPTIRGYVKKEKTDEDLKRLIGEKFTVKTSKEQQGCPCPIKECPFKSKALYLLIKGKEWENVV